MAITLNTLYGGSNESASDDQFLAFLKVMLGQPIYNGYYDGQGTTYVSLYEADKFHIESSPDGDAGTDKCAIYAPYKEHNMTLTLQSLVYESMYCYTHNGVTYEGDWITTDTYNIAIDFTNSLYNGNASISVVRTTGSGFKLISFVYDGKTYALEGGVS